MAKKTETTKTTETNNEEIFKFTGKVVRAFFGTTDYDDKNKNRVTLFAEDLDYSAIWAFNDCGPKYTPAWLKDAEGYINLSSKYDIPVKDKKGRKISFDDWLEAGLYRGAIVKAKIRQTEGAVYPVCLVIVEDGEEFDPFEDM